VSEFIGTSSSRKATPPTRRGLAALDSPDTSAIEERTTTNAEALPVADEAGTEQ